MSAGPAHSMRLSGSGQPLRSIAMTHSIAADSTRLISGKLTHQASSSDS